MGLNASIFRDQGKSYSNGGISEAFDRVCIVNVDGPFQPGENTPAVMLVPGNLSGTVKIVPAVRDDGDGPYVPVDPYAPMSPMNPPGMVGPMMGGCYVGTSDSRLGEAICKITGRSYESGIVALHDRFETPAEYDMLSR